MGRKYTNILETVGNTPVVKIGKLAPPDINLFVKIEAFNPLGSVKDRLALGVIEDLRKRAARAGITGNRQYNNGWHTAMDLDNMLVVSEAITRAALMRKESRGAQFREDYPNKDPEWGKYTIVVKRGSDGGMQVEKRTIPPLPAELKAVIEEMK